MNPEVLDGVIELVRETLALDDATPVRPEQLLFFDLQLSSMDFLDLLFRVEERFGVRIPEGTLRGFAQGELSDDAFAQEGALTPLGRERLMALLADAPLELFLARISTQVLYCFCIVAAVARLVEHRRAQAGG